METLTIDRQHSALLVMDYQEAIVGMLGDAGAAPLAATVRAVEAARSAGIPVIYVVVGFREGYPEANPRNRSFAAIRGTGRFLIGSPGSGIHAALAPRPGEVTVTKHRVSAFAGTDLEMILRAHDVQTLILCGLATSGVVLSTLRHAADADYGLVVVEDGCADLDPAVHECLVRKVFVRQAVVVTADQVVGALQSIEYWRH